MQGRIERYVQDELRKRRRCEEVNFHLLAQISFYATEASVAIETNSNAMQVNQTNKYANEETWRSS